MKSLPINFLTLLPSNIRLRGTVVRWVSERVRVRPTLLTVEIFPLIVSDITLRISSIGPTFLRLVGMEPMVQSLFFRLLNLNFTLPTLGKTPLKTIPLDTGNRIILGKRIPRERKACLVSRPRHRLNRTCIRV